MAITVGRWERRGDADLEALANAALAYCRAIKKQAGVRSSRFFWLGPDRIVIQSEADRPRSTVPEPQKGQPRPWVSLRERPERPGGWGRSRSSMTRAWWT
jgi:hypothetical protein